MVWSCLNNKAYWSINSFGILFELQNMNDSRLKAFNIGTMNAKKALSKKEQEEARKKV